MRIWTIDDVMTRTVVSVDEAASYRDIVDVLVLNRLSAVPVTDSGGRVVGVVSEADLLRKIEYAGDERPGSSTAGTAASTGARRLRVPHPI